MRILQMGRPACHDVERLRDAYADNELLAENALCIAEHLLLCERCRSLVEETIRLKALVRRAVLGASDLRKGEQR
jgi:anti-sigma factor RsiW